MAFLFKLLILVQIVLQLVHLTLLVLGLRLLAIHWTLAVHLVMLIILVLAVSSLVTLVVVKDSLKETLVLVTRIRLCNDQYGTPDKNECIESTHCQTWCLMYSLISQKFIDMCLSEWVANGSMLIDK